MPTISINNLLPKYPENIWKDKAVKSQAVSNDL